MVSKAALLATRFWNAALRLSPGCSWLKQPVMSRSYSVLLDLLGKFVLEFGCFASVGLSASTGLGSGPGASPGALCLSRLCASLKCLAICERQSVKAEKRVSGSSGYWEFAPGAYSKMPYSTGNLNGTRVVCSTWHRPSLNMSHCGTV